MSDIKSNTSLEVVIFFVGLGLLLYGIGIKSFGTGFLGSLGIGLSIILFLYKHKN